MIRIRFFGPSELIQKYFRSAQYVRMGSNIVPVTVFLSSKFNVPFSMPGRAAWICWLSVLMPSSVPSLTLFPLCAASQTWVRLCLLSVLFCSCEVHDDRGPGVFVRKKCFSACFPSSPSTERVCACDVSLSCSSIFGMCQDSPMLQFPMFLRFVA